MSRRWIRLDAEWEESGWIHALPGVARGCWPRLLCWVKLRGKRGRCRWPDPVVLAGNWKVPRTAVEAMLRGALEDEAIQRDKDEIVIVNWPEYQEPDGTAADRKRKQRAKESHGDVTVSRRDTPVTSRDTVTRPPTTDRERTTNHGTLRVVDGVENSEPEYSQPQEFTKGQLLEAAGRECGMGLWSTRQESSASSVLTSLMGSGKKSGEIWGAIHGARSLCNAGRITWLKPQTPFDLKALLGTFTLADQGDGKACRPLFDVALEEYIRADSTGPPIRTAASTGLERLAVDLPYPRQAQGSNT